ncbi:unnamed protein product [Rotaria socialis]|uniref:Uncharacterized protein n=1 Tax=Rotaria socialis TaxID=392032 RepID=A0A818HJ21_9BILA|nr:unnamed protein product [Rotaria socialis]
MMVATGDIIAHVVSNNPMNPSVQDASIHHLRISILREFALNATTHDIPGITRSRSMPNRIFWAIPFMAFTSAMVYFITEALCAYFEYPSQTKVSITNARIQHFPAFTICNAGGIRADALLKTYNEYTAHLNLTATSSNSVILKLADFMRFYFSSLVNEDGSLGQYVFPLESMWMSCYYVGIRCSVNDFIGFDSAEFGRCYKFNAKRKNGSLLYNHETDSTGKLLLRLYIHDHQYVPTVTEGVAMLAMAHDNTQLPMIEEAGMTLAPGFQHRLSYVKRDIQFLSEPYSSCTNEIPCALQIMFEKYDGAEYVYSEELRNMLCSQAYMYVLSILDIHNENKYFVAFVYLLICSNDQCGCVSPLQWNARTIVLPVTDKTIATRLCNVTNPCFNKAMNDFDLTQSIQDLYCSHCLQQCSTTEFVVKSSLSGTLPEWLIPFIREFVQNTSIPLPDDWSTRWREHIFSSYLSLELFSESSLIETYTQTPTLQPFDIFSNVGGLSSPWIGVSFLTIMELIEMLFLLIQHQIRLSRSANPENKKSDLHAYMKLLQSTLKEDYAAIVL